MAAEFEQFEDGGELRDKFGILLIEQKDIDDVEESVVESQRHLIALDVGIGVASFEFVYDVPDGFELLLGVRPKDKRFLQQIETSLHDLFVVFVAAVVEGHLDEEIQTNLCSLVIQGILKNAHFRLS